MIVRGKATPGRVERVDELRLRAWRRPEADVRASRLKVGEGARTRDFEPRANAGRPCLEIESACAGKAGVARREMKNAIREAQALQHRFGVLGDQLVLGVTHFGTHKPHELHLVELMHANQPPGVLPVRACLASETGRPGCHRDWERCSVEDLIAVHIGDRHFRRRDQEEVVAGTIEVVLELGQLAGPDKRRAIDHDTVAALPYSRARECAGRA